MNLRKKKSLILDPRSLIRDQKSTIHNSQFTINPRGLTLIELLVAVAIMSIMILAVGAIVRESQKLVAVGQGSIRANAAASSIVQVIRSDLRSASQEGFLCLTTRDNNGNPLLMVTTAGPARSVLGTSSGTGTLVCLGQLDNLADPGSAQNKILWRPGYVLASSGAEADLYRYPYAPVPPAVSANVDLAMLRTLARQDINNLVVEDMVSRIPLLQLQLHVPPVELGHVTNVWQILSAYCSELSICWTDGTIDDKGTPDPTDDELAWYGIEWDDSIPAYTIVPKDPNWDTKTLVTDNPEYPEYNADTRPGEPPIYRVLWTSHNQSNWPRAIRIAFRLRDPSMPADFEDVRYEVICPVRR